MTDPRLGKRGTHDQPDQLPETTLTGAAYTWPMDTVDISGGYFVVLDRWPAANQAELIAEVRAGLSKPGDERKPKANE